MRDAVVCLCSSPRPLHSGKPRTVVGPEHGAHQVVALVLDGACVEGHLGAEAHKVVGQVVGPQHRQVGLGRGAQVVKRVQQAVAGLGDLGEGGEAHCASGSWRRKQACLREA